LLAVWKCDQIIVYVTKIFHPSIDFIA
jgi:hypothetical protein